MDSLVTWDLPGDFADGGQTVSYFRRGRPPGVDISGAFRRGVAPTRMDRDRGWAGADAVWHLPENAVPGFVRPGDVLVDENGRRWTVLVVSVSATGRVIAWTRDWAASFSAAQLIDLELAETIRGSDGEPVIRWKPFLTGAAAQFLSCRGPEEGTHGDVVYRVLVAADIPLGTLRFRTGDGSIYRVMKAERPAVPGHPAVLHAVPAAPRPETF